MKKGERKKCIKTRLFTRYELQTFLKGEGGGINECTILLPLKMNDIFVYSFYYYYLPLKPDIRNRISAPIILFNLFQDRSPSLDLFVSHRLSHSQTQSRVYLYLLSVWLIFIICVCLSVPRFSFFVVKNFVPILVLI